MEPTTGAAPTTSPPDSAATPSFLEAYTAAAAAPAAAPASDSQAPTTGAPAADTPPATSGTPPAAAADNTDWLKGLGLGEEYKSPDDVKAALASIGQLKTNQLTDDHRAVLRLAEDPAAWREFNELTHLGDLKELADEEVLFRSFLSARPGADPEDARFLFEQEQDRKFPGLAEEPTERAHKAHLAERKREADQVRQTMTTARDARLAELKKGALPAAGPTPEQEEQQRADYLAGIDKLLDSHKEGYKMTVNVDGGALNLAVEPKDLPAFKAIVANPLGALLNAEGTALDPAKLMRFAAFHVQGDTLLADAYRAGKVGGGPQVSVDELHNANGNPIPPTQGGDGSFTSAFLKAAPAPAARPKY